MTRPLIIGLSGKAGAGKNTVGMYIGAFAYAEGKTALQMSFAQKLKDIAVSLGWDGKKDTPGRHFLQKFGTLCRDMIAPRYWVDAMFTDLTVQQAAKNPDIVVVTDVRFPNEIQAIKERGGQVWRIRKIGDDLLAGDAAGHASETALDDYEFDAYIDAKAGDLDGLWLNTEIVFDRLLRGD